MTVRICCILLTPIVASCVVSTDAAETVDYLTQVKPLLADKCYSCHGVLKQEGGLRLETRSLMVKGGDSGPAVNVQNPDSSLLLERIAADKDSRMPPAGEGAALTEEEIKLFRTWIDGGAIAPDEEIPEAPSRHWAFQKIVRPDLPKNSSETNPIDAFLSARRQANGITTQRF